MIVDDPDLFGDVFEWFAARRAARLKARKAKERQAMPKAAAPKRPAKKRVNRVVTAKDHRLAYGASPALRVIPGGKA